MAKLPLKIRIMRSKAYIWFYQKVYRRFVPAQKWLFDAIGNIWVDKDFVIETALFESMIHFWEDERGEEMQRFQFECIESPCRSAALKPEDQEGYLMARRLYAEMDKVYRYAKVRDQLWEEFWAGKHEPGQGWLKEQELKEIETEHLISIVKFRGSMWT